ncbi:hypothetical protein [uncultured Olleya sp.]|uniref:hypothetical protein n=1 Tax=uncultured Olleya sp. TaxID=757243 RepID=UPI002591E8B2|nr:hypothetical protein [uncultured Olleya sp.]
MNIIDSTFYHLVLKEINYSLGDLYMLQDVAVLQVNKGQQITKDSIEDILMELYMFYELKQQNFALISNNINVYTIDYSDCYKYTNLFSNLHFYGIVDYSNLNETKQFQQNNFGNTKSKTFKSLNEAFNYIRPKVLI